MLHAPESDSIIRCWHGLTARRFPVLHHCVSLLHFDTPYKHARHYLGSSSHLDMRLSLHKNGNGVRLMEVIGDAGIGWELARLWECDSREESLALERRLKHRHESPRLCPICRGEQVDLLVFIREGHWPMSTGKSPAFVRIHANVYITERRAALTTTEWAALLMPEGLEEKRASSERKYSRYDNHTAINTTGGLRLRGTETRKRNVAMLGYRREKRSFCIRTNLFRNKKSRTMASAKQASQKGPEHMWAETGKLRSVHPPQNPENRWLRSL